MTNGKCHSIIIIKCLKHSTTHTQTETELKPKFQLNTIESQ